MKKTITTLSIAATLLLAGCSSTSADPTPPAPTESSTPAAQAPQIATAPQLTEDQLKELPWASTFEVYRDAAPNDPGTPYRGMTASLPKGETFVVAHDSPGGNPFALVGDSELSSKTALPVVNRSAGWVQVLIPGRLNLPSSGKAVNSPSAWLLESEVELTENPLHVVVSIGKDLVEVRGQSGALVKSYPIIMDGKDLSATNVRGFAVSSYWTDSQRKCSSEKLLATSVQSAVYDHFADGGTAITGLHGWSLECRSVSAQRTRSSGCINLSDASMKDLLRRINPGTPVIFED